MSTHRAIRLGVAVLSAIALVASGTSPVVAVDSDPLRTLVGVSSPFGVAVHPSDGSVYVANQGGGVDASVLVFEKGMTTHNTTRTLHGVADTTNVAIQPGTGDVYVAAYFANVIHVFEAGSTSPNKSFSVSLPWDLEFDASGNLYVTSFLADRLLVFGPGATVPTREIVTPPQPMGVAVHPGTGDVYVGHGPLGSVTVFTAGLLVADSSKQLTGAGVGAFMAIGGSSGRVYVQDSDAVRVRVFDPGEQTPLAGGDLVGAGFPRGVAADSATGDVYVADMGGDQVLVYPSESTMTVKSITPVVGPVTGATAVTIGGENLGAVTDVTFGGVPATMVAAMSPTQVTAVAPAHAVGKVDVVVRWGSKVAGLANAFEYQAVAPGMATAVSGAPGNGQVTVTWTPPADTGGVPVASYTVTPSPAGPACATTATSCTIAGLVNGTRYRFVVRTTNTANLSSDSEASAEVKPYFPIRQKVKAKKASSKLPRKGFTTVVNWVKRPTYSARDMTANCTDGTARTTNQLCRVYSYKTGKVKVRTKGFRNVRVTITLTAIPKAGAPAQYGPSTTWTRTWRVR